MSVRVLVLTARADVADDVYDARHVRCQPAGASGSLNVVGYESEQATGAVRFEGVRRGTMKKRDYVVWMEQYHRVEGVNPRPPFGTLMDVDAVVVPAPKVRVLKTVDVGGRPLTIDGRPVAVYGAP